MIYYNENDPKAAAWLRELMREGLIPTGDVDGRDIQDVKPYELTSYHQQHFFAGIGGWAYALRLAGWPEDRPVRTGSCPCQPFSQSGKRLGAKDKRHLWPAFRDLITFGESTITFGEQVASPLGREWFAGVRSDLEGLGYEVGGADLCAAGVSAPHIRQRIYWVAHPNKRRRSTWITKAPPCADAVFAGLTGSPVGVANANGYHEQWWSGPLQVGWNCIEGEIERGGRKYRAKWRTKPGLSLLAYGVPGRVAQLCGIGNAIVPQLAAQFIQAAWEAINQ